MHTIKWKNFEWFVPTENLDIFFKHAMYDINNFLFNGQKSELLKKVRIKSLYRTEIEKNNGEELLIKFYKNEGVKSFISTRTKAFREFSMFLKCRERGIQTITPVCAGEEKRFILGKVGYVVLNKLKDVEGLDIFLERTYKSTNPAEVKLRRKVILEYARFANKIHNAGIYQDDFDPNNILLLRKDGEIKFYLIDFERARTFPHPLDLKRRIFLLSKLNRFQHASWTDRLRFLKAYCEECERQKLKYFTTEILTAFEKILKRDYLKGCNDAFKEGRNITIRKTSEGKFFIRRSSYYTIDDSSMWDYRENKPSEILKKIFEVAESSSKNSSELFLKDKKFIWMKTNDKKLAKEIWRNTQGLIRIKRSDVKASVLWHHSKFTLLVFQSNIGDIP